MVKRYKPTVTKVEALCYGGEHPDGEFVRFADYSALAAQRDELLHALMELRIRLHAAGRRPEECYEMSLIDAAITRAEHG